MPINAHPDYLAAEKEYLSAESLESKLKSLEKFISLSPKHKGAENLRAQLKTRYKKLKEQIEKSRKAKKSSGKKGIKKEDMQAVIIGVTKSGKSTLLSVLTNAKPKISSKGVSFTTKIPEVGMMSYGKGVQIQIVEVPSVGSEYYDKSVVNTADVVLVLITKLEELDEIKKLTENCKGKKIFVFNKSDMLSEKEKRKVSSNLQSRKYNFSLVSAKTLEGIEELREKIFTGFDRIRIYTKQPGKEKTEKPIILDRGSAVRDVAEKIFHGFSDKVKEIRITGPSSKFPNQIVGLKHILKDKDIVEFRMK